MEEGCDGDRDCCLKTSSSEKGEFGVTTTRVMGGGREGGRGEWRSEIGREGEREGGREEWRSEIGRKKKEGGGEMSKRGGGEITEGSREPEE